VAEKEAHGQALKMSIESKGRTRLKAIAEAVGPAVRDQTQEGR